jgi:hypothetical protein
MFDLPVHSRVCHDYPIHVDMVIITEAEKLFAGELRVVVGDDKVWDPEAMNDVDEEEHHLLGLNLCHWSSHDSL